jgi:ribosomal protein L24
MRINDAVIIIDGAHRGKFGHILRIEEERMLIQLVGGVHVWVLPRFVRAA